MMLSQNDSAKDVMRVPKLKDLAIILVNQICKDALMDWNLKENARGRMKIMIKNLLREYGYLLDM